MNTFRESKDLAMSSKEHKEVSAVRIIGPPCESNFTQVPNQVLNCDWPAGAKILWMQLHSLTRKGKSDPLPRRFVGIATELGISKSAFLKSTERLRLLGGLNCTNGQCQLLLPIESNDSLIQPTVVNVNDEVISVKDLPETIQASIDSKAKRKPSGVSPEVSWQAIKEVWDANKPEIYLQMKEPFDKMAFIALETHAKRLHIERPNYPSFVLQVLKGLAKDKWWPTAGNLKISSVFGRGALSDDKFERIEGFYRAGEIDMKPRFDCTNDKHWIKWYNFNRVSIDTVEQMTFDDRDSAQEFLTDFTRPERPANVARIVFIQGTNKPFHWSLQGDLRFHYLPEFA